VLISPWLPAGLGSDIFGGNACFDHASIIRALRSTFALGGQLTNRDEASPDWNSVLLAKPRTLNLKLPSVAIPKIRLPSRSLKEIAAREAPSGNILGTTHIAADVDWYTAERLHVPPLIVSDFEERLKHAQKVLTLHSDGTSASEELSEAHLSVLQYLAAVRDRDAKFQVAQRRTQSMLKKAKSKPTAQK
jgi:phospholipase C